ncbi:nucleotide sugar dehydrogenase [Candidatus Pelagibacter sp.]|jgi:UDP-N-acetyl-D-glucosamine dehydrogenase|nr:nucleotide sugar dehydrogenase [Candidatus Pelagibacter sp.]
MNNLLKKINQKKTNILVIGLGYVGLPLLTNIFKKKFKVCGLDINKGLIDRLRKKNKHINFYHSYKDINFKKIDIIIIALPTPLKRNVPDLSYLKKCMASLFLNLNKNQIIILESTSYPTTTDEVIVSKLDKNFSVGKNFYVGYSPEREDPGNKKFNIKNIPKIVSGKTNNCRKLVSTFYSKICDKIELATTMEVAEMTKLFENIFRSINISLSNETKEICKKINIDFNEVIKLASTKPFGFMPFYPGPGVGGHCIPVDPFYLSWFLKKKRIKSKFIELSGQINSNMPSKISKQIEKLLKQINYKNDNKILFLGLTYKKNIEDLRNSPSLEIFKYFKKKKYKIYFNDNYVNKIKIDNTIFNSQKLTQLNKFKAIVLLTDHDYLKKLNIKSYDGLILDTRFFFKNHKNLHYL